MRFCGYSEYFHDAGLAFVDLQGEIEFAAHAERYSKRKFDSVLTDEMVKMIRPDDHVTFYEDHQLRRANYMKREEEAKKVGGRVTDKNADQLHKWHEYVKMDALDYDDFIMHHESHASIGLFTRPWEDRKDTVILTVDGIGEQQAVCIYDGDLNCIVSWMHPLSIGLIYTKTTKFLGLRPMEDEYVVMGMASYGEPVYGEKYIALFEDIKGRINKPTKDLHSVKEAKFSKEFHLTIKQWSKELSPYDLAASVQYFAEHMLMKLARQCSRLGKKLIVSGGVAQNIVAMSKIKQSGLFDDMWIAVAPTDAGSALGAAAYQYWKQTGNDRVKWRHAYLGHDMGCTINPKEVVDHLLEHQYCGIASGRAEYGPRALGNRSLIADVRKDVKDTVNTIKRRQKYRPFAPAILEEFADQYFEGPMNEYMQYQAKAKHDYKSVTHVDGTGRVQIVKKDCQSIFRQVIEEYYERTGVPMLLNTSLNIRGQPMVNDHSDVLNFETLYRVKVFT